MSNQKLVILDDLGVVAGRGVKYVKFRPAQGRIYSLRTYSTGTHVVHSGWIQKQYVYARDYTTGIVKRLGHISYI